MPGIAAALDMNYRAVRDVANNNRKQNEEVRLKKRALDLSTDLLNFVVDWESRIQGVVTKRTAEPLGTPHSPDYWMKQEMNADDEMRAKAQATYRAPISDTLRQIAAIGENTTGIKDSMIGTAINSCREVSDRHLAAQCANQVGAIGREMM
jgi:hypothetical protein